MSPPASARRSAAIALTAIAAGACVAGCGSSTQTGSSAHASVAVGASPGQPSGCAATVLDTLGHVAQRIYSIGLSSERTASATHAAKASIPLREAIEHNNPVQARAAAQTLITRGYMTNLRVLRGGRVLADVGGPALAPVHGALSDGGGNQIGSFVTSVWADEGLLAETDGVTQGFVSLRAGASSGAEASIAGSFALPPGRLPARGTLTVRGIAYQYTSFKATNYPSGPLRVYLLRPISSTRSLCGASDTDTLVNTLRRVALSIYRGETGGRALRQVRRVQRDPALLRAVARRDPLATREASEALLNEHVVRLHVSAAGRLLSDVGGPFVLAPASGPLRLGGRTVGEVTLSIQDDEGYKRLVGRLAGLDVLMYMGSRLVKNSLGPSPAGVPLSGSYSYRGHSYRVFTIDAAAFPSGPLQIKALIPIPYS